MITIDIFSKKTLKGKTIYRVFRVGHEIPATVNVRVYTNCEVTGLSYSGGYFKYNIFGTDEDGNRVFVYPLNEGLKILFELQEDPLYGK